MPVYEYVCSDCRKVVSIFFRSMASQSTPVCPNCQGSNLARKISRVIVAKGDKRYFEGVDTNRMMGNYAGRDKGSQVSWARRVASELGDAGSEFREMAERVEGGADEFRLYDPAPLLEMKMRERIEKSETKGESMAGDNATAP